MSDKIIQCADIAQKIKDSVKERAKDKNYSLLILTNPQDAASQTYVRNKVNACKETGINAIDIPFVGYDKNSYTFKDLQYYVNRTDIPMILQLPLCPDLDASEEKLLGSIDPKRDADGLCPTPLVNPATPRGVMRILEEIGCNLDGKHVVVCGRSKLVGRPVAQMCLDKNATVTMCHSHTKDLAAITSQADVLIVAIGKPKFITAEYVKDGAIVIDVGINRDENNKLCGDVDLENVLDKVGAITPVPGGVGKLTVACLLENVCDLYEMRGK